MYAIIFQIETKSEKAKLKKHTVPARMKMQLDEMIKYGKSDIMGWIRN